MRYKKLKENKNLMFLWCEGLLKGAKLTMIEDGKEVEKIVDKVLDYDSITHVFRIRFRDGDIMNLSDKDRYAVKVPITVLDDIIIKPNKKRKKFIRKWKR